MVDHDNIICDAFLQSLVLSHRCFPQALSASSALGKFAAMHILEKTSSLDAGLGISLTG